MREKKIEQKLVTAVKKHGGICPKFVSPGFDGMPDRLLLLQHGRFAFVEVKAPNQKPRPLQLSRHRLLRRLGFRVYVLDALEDIDKIIKEVMSNETS
ncbi:VRR-NUC domain-containing protein [Ruminococcus sp.]